jgi:hypothetical protein
MPEDNQQRETEPLYSVGGRFSARYMNHVRGPIEKVQYLNGYWTYSILNTLTGGTELVAEHMLEPMANGE